MAEVTPIPSMKAAGRFEANPPFDRVVKPETFYTVEAIRTIPEMQGLKINVYDRVFKPVGLAEADYPEILQRAIANDSMVISLIPRIGAPVYVLSSYLKAFPLVDGYSYERMVLVADLGPLPIDQKDALQLAREHFQEYILNHYGIESTVQLGTVPVIGYLSKDEHDTMELVRKNRITDNTSDLALINDYKAQLVTKDAYIRELETRLGVNPAPPPVTP